MSRKFGFSLAFICCLAPTAGLASGAYLGASLGRIEVESAHSKGSGWTLNGGYRFVDWLAIEATYSNMDGATWYSCSLGACIPEDQYKEVLSAQRYELSALGTLPLGRNFSLFGKAGFGRLDSRMKSYVTTGGSLPIGSQYRPTVSRRNSDVFFGAGLSFGFTPAWSVRLMWDRQHVGAVDQYKGSVDIDSFLAGVHYSFGR